ncbi:MAG TPA: aldose 1-epimerase family protein [Pseudonocardiaceae bacterium]|jgi:aldose 1-epimerase
MTDYTGTMTATAAEPTGGQYALRHGDQQVVVTEVGAGLRSYTVGDWAVLDGYRADELCTAGRGQMLIPWPNRVEDGRYRFGGAEHQLALTEPAAGNAIHGLTRWSNWTAAKQDQAILRMHHTLHAQPGWPFVLGCELEFTLDDSGLAVRTTVTNLGAGPCPYASGAHPYLSVGTPLVDTARLRLPARTRYLSDQRGIPVGREPVPGGGMDGLIGPQRLDTAFTDLVRDADGLVRVRLSAPAGPEVTLWADEAYRWIQVFTGDGVPEPSRRRTGLAVEPMTAPPNALRTGEGLVTLRPGERHSARWGIRPVR